LFFPNSFTSNEDGINDYFEIQGNNILEFNLDIFDRWGSLLFSTSEMSLFWDGRFE
jgi:gliding motility-associated-like protein